MYAICSTQVSNRLHNVTNYGFNNERLFTNYCGKKDKGYKIDYFSHAWSKAFSRHVTQAAIIIMRWRNVGAVG